MPLLAGHYYGKGYVLFCAFDDTWRWRFNEADRYFGRFWTQAVYQAGVPRMIGTKLTQLSLDTAEPVQGKSGQVYARVLDENFKPVKAEEIDATLERLDAGRRDCCVWGVRAGPRRRPRARRALPATSCPARRPWHARGVCGHVGDA